MGERQASLSKANYAGAYAFEKPSMVVGTRTARRARSLVVNRPQNGSPSSAIITKGISRGQSMSRFGRWLLKTVAVRIDPVRCVEVRRYWRDCFAVGAVAAN